MSALVGAFIGVLFIPRLSDLYGRKPIFWIAVICSIPSLFVVTISSSLLLVDIAAFLAGPCVIARMACGFLMLMEQME